VGGFLAALGDKLAEKWLSLLVLPGLLFLAVAAGGQVLGQHHPFDGGRLSRRVDMLAAEPAAHATGTVVLVAAAVLAASAGAGLLAAALGGAVERLWLGDWPAWAAPVARALGVRRQRRWEAAQERYREAVTARVRGTGSSDTAHLNEARNRIALARPQRPTWMGDRLLAADSRVHRAYDLDLAFAWPRLWLVLPDAARADLQAARAAVATTARRGGWALLYLGVSGWWWPAAVIGPVTFLAAWYQGRAAVSAHAELVESAVDLYGRDLAAALGVPCTDGFTREVGLAVTRAVRKGA